MERIFITFLALSEFRQIRFESTDNISELINDLLCSFAKNIDEANSTVSIDKLQRNTSDLRYKVNSFVKNYSDELPIVNQVNDFLRKIGENEYFFFLPNEHLDIEKDSHYYLKLLSLESGLEYEKIEGSFNKNNLPVYKAYDVILYNEDSKHRIGEIDKTKRVCRFCNKSFPVVTFRNDAHAISESLGNKRIYLNEECDSCNTRFSQSIEEDIIEYFGFWRTIFKIKGKQGIPKTQGKNFKMYHEDKVVIKLDESSSDKTKFILKSKSFSHQNVYRALCKFAISVLDNKYLDKFEKTIDWINQELTVPKLPLISIRRTEYFKKHPEIIVYLNKAERKDLPFAVVDFQLYFFKYVYIIPLCSKNYTDFIKESEFKQFWSFFTMYSVHKDWSQIDFSQNEKREFEFRLKRY